MRTTTAAKLIPLFVNSRGTYRQTAEFRCGAPCHASKAGQGSACAADTHAAMSERLTGAGI